MLLTLLWGLQTQAQVFSKLSEKQRNQKLIKIARNVYRHAELKKYHDKYGESGKAEISSYKITAPDAIEKQIDGKKLGQLQYIVYLYSTTNNEWNLSYKIVKVYISDTAGKAWLVTTNNDNMTIAYWDIPEPFK